MQNPYLKQTNSKEELLKKYTSLVKIIANKLMSRLPNGFEIDDLLQVGMIGLLEAGDKFDIKKNIKFKTFAEYRIKGAMLDELRAKDWIPRSVRENSTKLEQAYTALRGKGLEEPSDQDLIKELGISMKELNVFILKAKPIPMLAIEDLGASNKSEVLDFYEILASPDETDPLNEFIESEDQNHLIEILDRLPEKEKMVLALYYQEDLNLKEIALVMGLTESRVSQIRTKAIAMMRSFYKEEEVA